MADRNFSQTKSSVPSVRIRLSNASSNFRLSFAERALFWLSDLVNLLQSLPIELSKLSRGTRSI